MFPFATRLFSLGKKSPTLTQPTNGTLIGMRRADLPRPLPRNGPFMTYTQTVVSLRRDTRERGCHNSMAYEKLQRFAAASITSRKGKEAGVVGTDTPPIQAPAAHNAGCGHAHGHGLPLRQSGLLLVIKRETPRDACSTRSTYREGHVGSGAHVGGDCHESMSCSSSRVWPVMSSVREMGQPEAARRRRARTEAKYITAAEIDKRVSRAG